MRFKRYLVNLLESQALAVLWDSVDLWTAALVPRALISPVEADPACLMQATSSSRDGPGTAARSRSCAKKRVGRPEGVITSNLGKWRSSPGGVSYSPYVHRIPVKRLPAVSESALCEVPLIFHFWFILVDRTCRLNNNGVFFRHFSFFWF